MPCHSGASPRLAGVDDALFAAPTPTGPPAPGPAAGGGTWRATRTSSAPAGGADAPAHPRRARRPAAAAGPGSPLRRLVEGDQSMSLLLWGPPGHRQDHDRLDPLPADRPASSSRSPRSPPGSRRCAPRSTPRAHGCGDRAGDGALRRRGAPLHQGPAGRPPAGRGEPLGDPGRRDHGEPVLLASSPRCSPRSLLLTLEPLTDDDVRAGPRRRGRRRAGPGRRRALEDEALEHLVRLAGGDARRALTYLEAAAGARAGQGAATVSTWPPPRRPWTGPPCATTARATSTTT